MPDIEKIIVDCKKRDREAQRALYEFFAPRLFAICLQYCNNRAEAEDLLHEGFIKVFTKIEQYNNKGPFEAWLRRLMVNTILEEFRKKKKIRLLTGSDTARDVPAVDDEENNEEVPEISHVMEMVNEMPDRYRLVFNLHVVEGFTHQQIAEAMTISIGTSKSNLSRARQWLKARIARSATKKHETLW